MRREFADGLCADPASVLIAEPASLHQRRLCADIAAALPRLRSDQLRALAGIVEIMTTLGDNQCPRS